MTGIQGAATFETAFQVAFDPRPDDFDELGHVNNAVYLRWAQEIAIAHWRARARADWVSAYVWVVVRHEIDYRAALTLEDEAEARTWVDPEGARGPLWARFVDIAKPGAKAAVSLKSTWCMLDIETRRPRRVPSRTPLPTPRSRPSAWACRARSRWPTRPPSSRARRARRADTR